MTSVRMSTKRFAVRPELTRKRGLVKVSPITRYAGLPPSQKRRISVLSDCIDLSARFKKASGLVANSIVLDRKGIVSPSLGGLPSPRP